MIELKSIGIFSELKARAKRWDEKHFDALRMRKDKLFDEYKEQQKKKRREAELINARLGEN
jgi:structural maintenance of chromosome 1